MYITGGMFGGDESTKANVVIMRRGSENVEVEEISPMHYPRTVHATAVTGHFLFVFGGYSDSFIETCEVLNTTTNT